MGYTHYMNTKKEIDADKWQVFLGHARKVIEFATPDVVELAGPDETGQPEFTDDDIMFNGVGDDAHETMEITRTPNSSYFCKTARKPYDIVCVAILVIAKAVFGDAFEWSSDGNRDDHMDGFMLAQMAVGEIATLDCLPQQEFA